MLGAKLRAVKPGESTVITNGCTPQDHAFLPHHTQNQGDWEKNINNSFKVHWQINVVLPHSRSGFASQVEPVWKIA